ncbi:hypothetical protein CKR_3232 [Clostridium kluyveri NBRC 12016]|nr:hypothetical protein CKR_3232 [Clostridium kluyveri NBRC 12016]
MNKGLFWGIILMRHAENKDKNLIGDRVKYARLKNKPKVTQNDLLARLAVRGIELEKTTISKIESKTRPVTDKELVAIADALNVSILWLLGKD